MPFQLCHSSILAWLSVLATHLHGLQLRLCHPPCCQLLPLLLYSQVCLPQINQHDLCCLQL